MKGGKLVEQVNVNVTFTLELATKAQRGVEV
jgi:hypothetical protein